MSSNRVAVVAIGGNALSDGRSTVHEQMGRAYQAAELIRTLVTRDFHVVVVHGNGPQVGMAYLRQLAGLKENLPPLNLALCDALTQAEIGTMLELAIINTLNRDVPDIEVLTMVSQVEVGADDPAFRKPSKPVGPFYSMEEADNVKQQFPEWTMVEDSGRGYRRVVPSPVPLRVFSASSIPDTFRTAKVIIAGGGGGIPVVRKPDNTFELVDAVIDKDRTAYLIGQQIKASHFFVLTGVPHVSINFGKPNQQPLHKVSVAEARRYMEEGHFPAGSMGPKMEAAIQFAERAGGTAIITNAANIANALEDKEGTHVHP